ncbi:baseplate J/gp47 family protein [Halohasta salina]|uniref:baseplate J/gp47 family protein n=1 Tax=Halohasta salina TaxID=2961621 RepID=UPI0020A38B26|nr:baseplate J/gp47 family protein [Halohasta salina]
MSRPPVLDHRDREAIEADLLDRADRYLDDWDADSADTATVLLRAFAHFEADLVDQLNRLPRKHRAAFLDTLGVDRRPPQAARLPLSVTVSADLDRNVPIPGGTQAMAETADGGTELFELPREAGFEATPAALTAVRTVDPASDRIVTHPVSADEPRPLFTGSNDQEHALYLGDESLFRLDPGSALTVAVEGSVDAEALDSTTVWEYYGTDADGTEGWHRLESAAAPRPVDDSATDPRLSRLPPVTEGRDTGNDWAVRLRVPGEIVQTTFAGTESRWIRCRLVDPTPACFAAEIEQLRVGVDRPDTERSPPDAAVADDVPLSPADGDLRPFGRRPRPSSTLYLAADDALTKPGARLSIRFHPPASTAPTDAESTDAAGSEPDHEADFGMLEGPPEISWEYWNGTGWAGLEVVDDDTDRLRESGDVIVVVPDDSAETAVSGREARWIRARLVGGSYGSPAVAGGEPTTVPHYGRLSVAYDHAGSSVDHVRTRNNCTVDTPEPAFRPFERPTEASQTLYLGFDDTLRGGPVPLFVPLAERRYPPGFDSGVRWEYCSDPTADEWSTLPVDDGTGGLTERGIVSLRFPEPTTAHERFGTERHWIRAVAAGDRFATGSSEGPAAAGSAADSPAVDPPSVSGFHPNTGWADNVRTVEAEILGSSDGTAAQTFGCAHGPLIDCELWVDEAGSLSAAERAELREAAPDRIEPVGDDEGDPEAVWVRWEAVDEFVDCGPDRRVYRPDRVDGTITFGDGDAGAIPPEGGTVRATYTTGGGAGGNVDAGAITALKTPISLVESVENPFPADGGAGVEPLSAVETRVADRLRTRGRAVTPADFERVATAAVRKLAVADCRPELDAGVGGTGGGLTLLVVPDADRDRPVASMALQQQVREAVTAAAPTTLTAGDGSITVRPPRFAAVSVDATVRSAGTDSRSALTAAVESALAAFLHPLTGGPDSEGWPIGDRPTVDALASVVESVPGVDRVAELSATVTVDDDRYRLGAAARSLPADGLICDGSHEITVRAGDLR